MLLFARSIVTFFANRHLANPLILLMRDFPNVEKCYKIPHFVTSGEIGGLFFVEKQT
jgi:hypothetical protein